MVIFFSIYDDKESGHDSSVLSGGNGKEHRCPHSNGQII
jgi:hypothetical protein